MRVSWETRRRNREYADRLYTRDFVTTIRERVCSRDNWACQECDAVVEGSEAHVHHINYQKKDDREMNLITLCRSCHTKTNFNRAYWQPYFERKMRDRFPAAA
jgi:5-methylcytosine-specific restriction endonuclease McrA